MARKIKKKGRPAGDMGGGGRLAEASALEMSCGAGNPAHGLAVAGLCVAAGTGTDGPLLCALEHNTGIGILADTMPRRAGRAVPINTISPSAERHMVDHDGWV